MVKAVRARQFVIVLAHERGERIPLRIADFDRNEATITLVIQAVGKKTRELQQTCCAGTQVHALVGPAALDAWQEGCRIRSAGGQ